MILINKSKYRANMFRVHYFARLLQIFQKIGFLANPRRIHNVDECGLQTNNEPGKVVATKDCRDVHHVTSGQRGETISLIACCNAEGKFLPPYSIFKGKRRIMNSKMEYHLVTK
jgi:hypothetical protein